MERKETKTNGIEVAINHIDNEVKVYEAIRKDAIDRRNAIEDDMKAEIEERLSPMFIDLGENWTLNFELERLTINRVNETNSWNSFDIRYYGIGYVSEEGGKYYQKIEIGFSSASGNDVGTLERCVAQGKVAGVVLDYSNTMLGILNEIHDRYSLEKTKASRTQYDAEKHIQELKREKSRIELNLLKTQAQETGLEFTSVKDRYDYDQWPEFEVKKHHEISHIIGCKITNVTPTGKMMNVEFTYFMYTYDTEAGCNKRYEKDFKDTVRVTTEKVESFLNRYKDQIVHPEK